MIIKKVWVKERYHRNKFTLSGARFTHQPYEGWYLLGLIPLYIRARGPERDKHTNRVFGAR